MNHNTIASALEFMIQHTKGKRSDGTPSFLHPIRVAMMLIEADCIEETVIAGILHDVLEDTKVPVEMIERRYGLWVSELVKSLTHGEEDDDTVLERVIEGGEEAVKIKLSDNTDNIRTITHFKPEKQPKYLEYASKILLLGEKILGKDHPLVDSHRKMLDFATNLPF